MRNAVAPRVQLSGLCPKFKTQCTAHNKAFMCLLHGKVILLQMTEGLILSLSTSEACISMSCERGTVQEHSAEHKCMLLSIKPQGASPASPTSISSISSTKSHFRIRCAQNQEWHVCLGEARSKEKSGQALKTGSRKKITCLGLRWLR